MYMLQYERACNSDVSELRAVFSESRVRREALPAAEAEAPAMPSMPTDTEAPPLRNQSCVLLFCFFESVPTSMTVDDWAHERRGRE